jgi:hypothetical protein
MTIKIRASRQIRGQVALHKLEFPYRTFQVLAHLTERTARISEEIRATTYLLEEMERRHQKEQLRGREKFWSRG